MDYLPLGDTVIKEYYFDVLCRLKEAIKNKRKGLLSKKVFLTHDNARPHTANLIKILLQDFKWDVSDHPPYSPDLAPSDYHLFCRLKKFLGGKRFSDQDELENTVNGWFQEMGETFYSTGIEKLVSRMDKCLNLNGDYVEKSEIY